MSRHWQVGKKRRSTSTIGGAGEGWERRAWPYVLRTSTRWKHVAITKHATTGLLSHAGSHAPRAGRPPSRSRGKSGHDRYQAEALASGRPPQGRAAERRAHPGGVRRRPARGHPRRGQTAIYEDPTRFFALTYPTHALRELVKDVAERLAGKSPKAVRQLELTYGGGKTHTLITLYHLFRDPAALSEVKAVQEFRQHVGAELPRAFPVSLCFDKIDVERGIDGVRAPDGETRSLKHPWSVLAFQLAGAEGLRAIHGDAEDEERETPACRAAPRKAAGPSAGAGTRNPGSGRRGADVCARQGGHGPSLARADRRLLPASRAGRHQGGPGGPRRVAARLRSGQAGPARPSPPIRPVRRHPAAEGGRRPARRQGRRCGGAAAAPVRGGRLA